MPDPNMIAVGLLSVLFVYTSWLAYRYAVKVDQLKANLTTYQERLEVWHGAALRSEGDREALLREIETKGYGNYEIDRLRNANNKLAVQHGQLSDGVQDYMELLKQQNRFDDLQQLKKTLDEA